MIYGNGNFDDFTLEANNRGHLELLRNGLKTDCHFQVGGERSCGDWCSVFHREDCHGRMAAHLCCCNPPVVILIRRPNE